MRANNIRFSFCCDEWTSLDNKIYYNLTLFTSNNTYNLGLTRIRGKFYATTGLELIKEKLEEFGINYASHIVAMTSDGAAVIKKNLVEYHLLKCKHVLIMESTLSSTIL